MFLDEDAGAGCTTARHCAEDEDDEDASAGCTTARHCAEDGEAAGTAARQADGEPSCSKQKDSDSEREEFATNR